MPEAPTETIVSAMEQADKMEYVVVIWRLKADAEGHSGIGWMSNIAQRDTRIGMVREAEFLMHARAYGVVEND